MSQTAHKWLKRLKPSTWIEWLCPVLTPPTDLDWRYNVGKHRVVVTWEKSKCSSVTSQRINVEINNKTYHKNVELGPNIDKYAFFVESHDVVHVTVFAVIKTRASDTARLTFIVPDLSKPMPPANLKWESVETFPPDEEDSGVDN